MPRQKIPPEAFSYYRDLGVERSYQAVANHYGVTKKAVTNRAIKEGWQKRLEKLETLKSVNSIQELKEQRLKALSLIQAKAIETLKRVPFTSPMDAVRAMVLSIRELRVELGEC